VQGTGRALQAIERAGRSVGQRAANRFFGAKPTAGAPAAESATAEVAETGMKFPSGISPAEGKSLTQAIRDTLKIEGRNVAVAEVRIGEQSRMLSAVSGKASPPGTVPAPTDPLFTTRSSGAMTRAFDTEVKILEDIAKDLPSNAKGTISLYTELKPCFSCKGVIEQFETRFPGIKLNITHGQ
jgi:hypothetical protein